MAMIKMRAVWGQEGRDLWLDPREIAAVEAVVLEPPEADARPVTDVTLRGGVRFLVDMSADEFVRFVGIEEPAPHRVRVRLGPSRSVGDV